MSDDGEIAEALAGMVQHYTPPAPPAMRVQLAAELGRLCLPRPFSGQSALSVNHIMSNMDN